MWGMLRRMMTERVVAAMRRAPVVALLGARQVGKTTLAKMLAEAQPAVYLDLEAPGDLARLADPPAYLRQHGDKLVILDEIQRAPEIFATLRGLVDDNRWQGQSGGQFLLLGSASMNLMRQTSESLAGRIAYLEMGGFNALETAGEADALARLWLRGGFPNSYLAADDGQAMDWLEDLLRTYLERDLPQLGLRAPASRLRRLWTMLAHLQGEPVNTHNLATNLETQRAAINRYLDILADLLLVRRLPPWHANVGKRLVKSPRCYVRDSGVLHRLLGIGSHDALLSHPVLGKSWEGFVMENLHSALPHRAETFFYRTASGAEIDLLIRLDAAEVWAVEIKHGSAPKAPRHFSRTCAEAGATRKFVVHGGDEEFPLGGDVTAIPLPALMRLLQERAG